MLPHHTKVTKYIFIVFILVVLSYAYFEARSVLFGPQIELGSSSSITVENELIEISGTVKNVSLLELDGRKLLIDDSGIFNEKILLAEGVNSFVFYAKDKFGRETERKLEVVYQPKNSSARTQEETGTIKELLENN